jgi:PKD repeat protein
MSGLVSSPSSHAVLFESTGDPGFNTTAPSGTLSGSGWQYEGLWNTENGGFLGTPVAPMFFLAAKHVGGAMGDAFVLNGFTYHTVASNDCPNCDLRLWQVAETFPMYAPLYTASNEVGKKCVVFGRGTDRGAPVIVGGRTNGWTWGATNWVERWGQNIVSDVYTDQTNGEMLQASFGINECDLSDGDSSGGMFIQNQSTWQLAGIHHGVDGPFSVNSTGNPQFDAALLDMSGLYAFGISNNWILVTGSIPTSFYSTRISANLAWISGVLTGASPVAPVANFSATPTNGPWPLTVTFTDTSTGTLTNRIWNFGDGSATNTTANILTHTYGGSGTNTVSLTVSGSAGTSSVTLTNYIVIGNEEAPATPEGLVVTFVSANEIDLSWMASTNASDLGFVGYEVFRNGVQVMATMATNLADRNLAPSSNYCYAVVAYNAQRTASPASASVCTNTFATPGSLLGTYSGLAIQTNAPSNASSGNLQLVISKTGAFTAKLNMGGVKSSFRGQFDASGNSTNTVTPHGLNQLQVILHLDIENQTDQITGTVSDGTFASVLVANRAVFSRRNPCPQAGQYAVVFDVPTGSDTNLPSSTGNATFTVTTAGTGRMTGILGDGTKINVSAPVSQYGTWPLYEALYTKKQGACVGWMSFDTNNTFSATVDWYRPPMPKSRTFPLGFSTTVTLTGQ